MPLCSFPGPFGFVALLGFLLPLDDVERFDDVGNDLVYHGSLLVEVGASKSTYFGLLSDLDLNLDPDAINELFLSYAAVRNKNPLSTMFTLPLHRSYKACQAS